MVTALKIPPTTSLGLPPRLALLLTQLAPTPDPELALRKVLSDYIDLKLAVYQADIDRFEAKWGMEFPEFAQACAQNTLGQDPYSYTVESDYWEWEAAHTQQNHFLSLRGQWI